ncbi:MAG: hypothetical protein ACI94Y_002298 [Maribacter sp.]|jgi:hypothetical protein
MSLKKFVVISEMSGVHKMIGNRSNGLIIEDCDSGKRKFVSSRKHQFTPLDSISIYMNDGETIPLNKVFETMSEKAEAIPIPSNKVNATEAFEYMDAVLPNYDQDQVYYSDVKKLVKWFSFLNARDLLDFTEEEEETTEETTEATTEAIKTEE